MSKSNSDLCPCHKYHCASSRASAHAAKIADHAAHVKTAEADAEMAARYVAEQRVLCPCSEPICAETRAKFKLRLKDLCICDRPHCAAARTALKDAAEYYSDDYYETSEDESSYDEPEEEKAKLQDFSTLWDHAKSLLVTLPNWLPEHQRDALQQITHIQQS